MAEIFGRDDEIAALLGGLRAIRGSGGALIEGPAGIGKTTVFDTVLAALEAEGWRILAARPSEIEMRMSLLGLHDLLDPVLAEARTALPPAQAGDLERALGPEQPDKPIDEGRLGLAVLAALKAASAGRPTVVAIDDVQWLDQSSAAALQLAVRRIGDARLLVIAARRVATPSPTFDVTQLFGTTLVRQRLEPLTVGAMHRVIVSRLGRSLPRPTVVRIHEASGGNMVYALEFARALEHGQALPEELDAVVPEELSDLLWRRVRGTSQDTQDLVLLASLASRPSVDLAMAAFDRSRSAVEAAVAEADESGLLTDDHGVIRLGHPLVGSIVRHHTPAGRRRALHAMLAHVVTDDDEAALHQAQAAESVDEPAAAALEASARRAFERGGRIDALERFERALRLTPSDQALSIARRRVGLAEAAIVAGDVERASAELESLDIPAIADPVVRTDAAMMAAAAGWLGGRIDDATTLLEHLVEDQSTPPGERGRLHGRLGLLYDTDRRRSREHLERALALLDEDRYPADYGASLMMFTGNRLLLLEAADHEGMERGAALQLANERWDASTLPMNWPIWMDQWAAGRAILDDERAKAEANGDETTINYEMTLRVEIDIWSGHLDAALDTAERAVEHASATGQGGRFRSAVAIRGLAHALRGDLEAAEADATHVLSMLTGAHASTTMQTYVLGILGAVARARDDLATTERLLGEAFAILDATGDLDQPSHRFHGDRIDALVGLGRYDEATALVDRLTISGSLGPRPVRTAIADRGRAMLAMAAGDLDLARLHLEQALEAHGRTDVPYEEARTRLVYGQLERRAGRRRRAADHINEAEAQFVRIGARGWAARAAAEKERLGIQRGTAERLTPTEERIAALAASGLRNGEIATRMLISQKTVEANLARAYAKLGIRARAELSNALRHLRDADR